MFNIIQKIRKELSNYKLKVQLIKTYRELPIILDSSQAPFLMKKINKFDNHLGKAPSFSIISTILFF